MLGSNYWRQKADEYRKLAANADNDTDREAYLTLAENCDELATRQGELAKEPEDASAPLRRKADNNR